MMEMAKSLQYILYYPHLTSWFLRGEIPPHLSLLLPQKGGLDFQPTELLADWNKLVQLLIPLRILVNLFPNPIDLFDPLSIWLGSRNINGNPHGIFPSSDFWNVGSSIIFKASLACVCISVNSFWETFLLVFKSVSSGFSIWSGTFSSMLGKGSPLLTETPCLWKLKLHRNWKNSRSNCSVGQKEILLVLIILFHNFTKEECATPRG